MPQHAHFSIHRSSFVAKLHCFQIYQRPFGKCVETRDTCKFYRLLQTQTPRDDVQKSWLQQLLCGVRGKGDLFRKTSPESNSAGWKRWKLKEKISTESSGFGIRKSILERQKRSTKTSSFVLSMEYHGRGNLEYSSQHVIASRRTKSFEFMFVSLGVATCCIRLPFFSEPTRKHPQFKAQAHRRS